MSNDYAVEQVLTPHLEPTIEAFVSENHLDSVAGAFEYAGGEDLHKFGLGNRIRTRLTVPASGDQPLTRLYMKRYGLLATGKRIKRWLTGKGRQCEAKQEYENVRAVRSAGIPTMREIALGVERDWLGVRRSYIIVDEVPGDALERVGEAFFERHGLESQAVEDFNTALVTLVGSFHQAGFVHRDFYASHIFVYELPDGQVKLNLIDLARVIRPWLRGFRWRVKDLAQLKYSMHRVSPAWVGRYWDAFLRAYLGEQADTQIGRWQRAIEAKVNKMIAHDVNRAARQKAQQDKGVESAADSEASA